MNYQQVIQKVSGETMVMDTEGNKPQLSLGEHANPGLFKNLINT